MDIQSIKNKFSIVGNSEKLNRVIDKAIIVAPTDISVLIMGESGVGKENVSKIIHSLSKRKHNKFISVNCGAIPEGTIDSELFGHEKGAFTGAITSRKGYFESADGGTIFLDEIGDLPFNTQVKLLRILETGEFIKVGSSEIIKTDVRVIAATNINILEAINKNKFREDLYYRLNTVEINIPPLRERKEDIHIIFRKFAMEFSEKNNTSPVRLDKEAIELLNNYYWKGNIRQLKNIANQISIFESKKIITKEIIEQYLPNNKSYLPFINSDTNISDNKSIYNSFLELKKEVSNLKKILWEIISTKNDNKGKKEEDKIIDIANTKEKEFIKKSLYPLDDNIK